MAEPPGRMVVRRHRPLRPWPASDPGHGLYGPL